MAPDGHGTSDYLKLQCTLVESDKNQSRRYVDVQVTSSVRRGPLFLFLICSSAITSFVICSMLLL